MIPRPRIRSEASIRAARNHPACPAPRVSEGRQSRPIPQPDQVANQTAMPPPSAIGAAWSFLHRSGLSRNPHATAIRRTVGTAHRPIKNAASGIIKIRMPIIVPFLMHQYVRGRRGLRHPAPFQSSPVRTMPELTRALAGPLGAGEPTPNIGPKNITCEPVLINGPLKIAEDQFLSGSGGR